MMVCLRCGSTYVRRSMIRWWERPLLRYTPKRPHRCEECAWRGWIMHQHVERPRMTAVPELRQSRRPELDLDSLNSPPATS